MVESIAVPEAIKTRTGDFRQKIDNHKASIRAVAQAGIKVCCYNFMAITDWTRTDLDWPLPNGGTALRFDIVDFCAYDVLVLKRRRCRSRSPGGAHRRGEEAPGLMARKQARPAGAQPDRLGAGARDGL